MEYIQAAYNNEDYTSFSLVFQDNLNNTHSVYVMKGLMLQRSIFIRDALSSNSHSVNNPQQYSGMTTSSSTLKSLDLTSVFFSKSGGTSEGNRQLPTGLIPAARWEIIESAIKFCHSFHLNLQTWSVLDLKDITRVAHRLGIETLLNECIHVITQKLSNNDLLNDSTWCEWFDFTAEFPENSMLSVRAQLEHYLSNSATIRSVANLPTAAAKLVLVHLMPFGTEEEKRKCAAVEWLENAFNGHISLSDMIQLLRNVEFEKKSSNRDVQLLQEKLYGHKDNTMQIFGGQTDLNVIKDVGAFLANTTNNLLKNSQDNLKKTQIQFKTCLEDIFRMNNAFYESVDDFRPKLQDNPETLTKDEIEKYRTKVDEFSIKLRRHIKPLMNMLKRLTTDDFNPVKLMYTDEEAALVINNNGSNHATAHRTGVNPQKR